MVCIWELGEAWGVCKLELMMVGLEVESHRRYLQRPVWREPPRAGQEGELTGRRKSFLWLCD